MRWGKWSRSIACAAATTSFPGCCSCWSGGSRPGLGRSDSGWRTRRPPSMAERVRTALVAAYRPKDCFVSLATGVLGTHVGVGAWAIFYQVED